MEYALNVKTQTYKEFIGDFKDEFLYLGTCNGIVRMFSVKIIYEIGNLERMNY